MFETDAEVDAELERQLLELGDVGDVSDDEAVDRADYARAGRAAEIDLKYHAEALSDEAEASLAFLRSVFEQEDGFSNLVSSGMEKLLGRIDGLEKEKQEEEGDQQEKQSQLLRVAAELYEFTHEEAAAFRDVLTQGIEEPNRELEDLLDEDEKEALQTEADEVLAAIPAGPIVDQNSRAEKESTTIDESQKSTTGIDGSITETEVYGESEEPKVGKSESTPNVASEKEEKSKDEDLSGTNNEEENVDTENFNAGATSVFILETVDFDAAIVSSDAYLTAEFQRQTSIIENARIEEESRLQQEKEEREREFIRTVEKQQQAERLLNEQMRMLSADAESRDSRNFAKECIREDRAGMRREDQAGHFIRKQEQDVERKAEQDRLDREYRAMRKEDTLAAAVRDQERADNETVLMISAEKESEAVNQVWRDQDSMLGEDRLSTLARDKWKTDEYEVPGMSENDCNVITGKEAFQDGYWSRREVISTGKPGQQQKIAQSQKAQQLSNTSDYCTNRSCYSPSSCSSRSSILEDDGTENQEGFFSFVFKKYFNKAFYTQKYYIREKLQKAVGRFTRLAVEKLAGERKSGESAKQQPQKVEAITVSNDLVNLDDIGMSDSVEDISGTKNSDFQLNWSAHGIMKIAEMKQDPSKLRNLLLLNLSKNKLRGADLGAQLAESCPMLEYLYAQQNQLESLQGLEGMSNLHTLNASFNCLKDIDFMSKRCTRLAIADFRANQIERLPVRGKGVLNLTELILYRNQITEILPNCILGDCARMRHLDLGKNRLGKMPTPFLSEWMPLLEMLILSHNKIGKFEDAYFILLRELWLDGNSLTDVRNLGFFPSLTELHLENNRITALVAPVCVSPALKALYLSCNCLKKLARGILQGFPWLEKLKFDGNVGLCEKPGRYRKHVLRALRNLRVLKELDGKIFVLKTEDSYYDLAMGSDEFFLAPEVEANEEEGNSSSSSAAPRTCVSAKEKQRQHIACSFFSLTNFLQKFRTTFATAMKNQELTEEQKGSDLQWFYGVDRNQQMVELQSDTAWSHFRKLHESLQGVIEQRIATFPTKDALVESAFEHKCSTTLIQDENVKLHQMLKERLERSGGNSTTDPTKDATTGKTTNDNPEDESSWYADVEQFRNIEQKTSDYAVFAVRTFRSSKEKSAICMQSHYRGYVGRRTYYDLRISKRDQHFRSHRASIIRLQTRLRGWITSRRYVRFIAARRIQKIVRGRNVRTRFKRLFSQFAVDLNLDDMPEIDLGEFTYDEELYTNPFEAFGGGGSGGTIEKVRERTNETLSNIEHTLKNVMQFVADEEAEDDITGQGDNNTASSSSTTAQKSVPTRLESVQEEESEEESEQEQEEESRSNRASNIVVSKLPTPVKDESQPRKQPAKRISPIESSEKQPEKMEKSRNTGESDEELVSPPFARKCDEQMISPEKVDNCWIEVDELSRKRATSAMDDELDSDLENEDENRERNTVQKPVLRVSQASGTPLTGTCQPSNSPPSHTLSRHMQVNDNIDSGIVIANSVNLAPAFSASPAFSRTPLVNQVLNANFPSNGTPSFNAKSEGNHQASDANFSLNSSTKKSGHSTRKRSVLRVPICDPAVSLPPLQGTSKDSLPPLEESVSRSRESVTGGSVADSIYLNSRNLSELETRPLPFPIGQPASREVEERSRPSEENKRLPLHEVANNLKQVKTRKPSYSDRRMLEEMSNPSSPSGSSRMPSSATMPDRTSFLFRKTGESFLDQASDDGGSLRTERLPLSIAGDSLADHGSRTSSIAATPMSSSRPSTGRSFPMGMSMPGAGMSIPGEMSSTSNAVAVPGARKKDKQERENAKLAKVAEEWGFTDLATAAAFISSQKKMKRLSGAKGKTGTRPHPVVTSTRNGTTPPRVGRPLANTKRAWETKVDAGAKYRKPSGPNAQDAIKEFRKMREEQLKLPPIDSRELI